MIARHTEVPSTYRTDQAECSLSLLLCGSIAHALHLHHWCITQTDWRSYCADGALIVTTPQEVAIIDVRKELSFCRKTSLPVLGVVENMSGLATPLSNMKFMSKGGQDISEEVLKHLPEELRDCLATCDVFSPSKGGAEAMAKQMSVAFLGRVPLDPEIGKVAEEGGSIQDLKASSSVAAFNSIVDGVLPL